jgi:uncharacterized phage-like protein YoqJ
MNTTKLKKTLEKRVNVVFDQFVDWFDVVGVLGVAAHAVSLARVALNLTAILETIFFVDWSLSK